jgi:hypothetical protein
MAYCGLSALAGGGGGGTGVSLGMLVGGMTGGSVGWEVLVAEMGVTVCVGKAVMVGRVVTAGTGWKGVAVACGLAVTKM